MKVVYLAISAVFLFSCSPENNSKKIQQELIDTDKAFSALSSDSGMNHAFLTYCAMDGILLKPKSMPVVGFEAISASIKGSDDSSFELTWEPLDARVAESGDLGFTYGIYALKMNGAEEPEKGTYVSIWTKEKGTWKFVIDSGNEGLGE